MADPVVPAPGKETSEFSLAKLFTYVALAIAALIPILAGATSALDGLSAVFPGAKWIAVLLSVLGTLTTIAMTINKYIGSRTAVKVAQAGANAAATVTTPAQAAQALRGG